MDPILILVKDFRRAIATTYLKLGHGSIVMRGSRLSFHQHPGHKLLMTFALTYDIICLARETNRGVANTKIARAYFSLIALSVK